MGRRRRRPDHLAGTTHRITGLTVEAAHELADRLAEEGIPARVGRGGVHVTRWEDSPGDFAEFESRLSALAAEYGGAYAGAASSIDPWE